MSRVRARLFWVTLVFAVAVPIVAALMSPLLAWRDPIYIAAGLAGVFAMAILLFQPLLAAGYLPGFAAQRGRQVHRQFGIALLLLVALHVAGLWITSPPDVIDALLFVSPTPFSIWGVVAMWGLFATACLALFRRRLKLRAQTWRFYHKSLAIVIVLGSVVHAILIEGTMELFSKSMLCILVLIATVVALVNNKYLK